MTIDKGLSGHRLTLRVCGRLDTNTSPDLEEALKMDGVAEVVFDFAGLEYISSAGLRVLMMAQRSLAPVGGKVMVAHPNDMVRGVLEMTGLSNVFEIT